MANAFMLCRISTMPAAEGVTVLVDADALDAAGTIDGSAVVVVASTVLVVGDSALGPFESVLMAVLKVVSCVEVVSEVDSELVVEVDTSLDVDSVVVDDVVVDEVVSFVVVVVVEAGELLEITAWPFWT